MSDDAEQERILNSDEVQEIIEWAIGTAATVLLMQHSPDHENVEEAMSRLNGFLMAVDNMVNEIPDCMADAAVTRANNAYSIAEENEEIVEQFVESLDDEDFIKKLQGEE
jgi:hypothetical protein